MASRRKRGPIALRLWLWLGLPLSEPDSLNRREDVSSGMYLERLLFRRLAQLLQYLRKHFASVARNDVIESSGQTGRIWIHFNDYRT